MRLDFLKSTPYKFLLDPVDASDIAEVLLENRVYHIVMNACRSGHASNLNTNIAAALISCGLSAVIAMSYEVSSHSVQEFTRAFYQDIFLGNEATSAETAWLGRGAVRLDCAQSTIYGVSVRVQNEVVPI